MSVPIPPAFSFLLVSLCFFSAFLSLSTLQKSSICTIFYRVHIDVLIYPLFVFLFVTYWFSNHIYIALPGTEHTSKVSAQVNRFEPLFPHRQCEEGELF